MDDLISILIPTYNRAGMVKKAIKSIRSQTYTNYEIIVYDDGSIDKTWKTLEAYGKKIRAIRGDKNRGCAYARNVLMGAAKGKYVCWQDSDDWSNINRLRCQYDIIKEGHVMVIARCIWSHDMKSTPWTKAPVKTSPKKGGKKGKEKRKKKGFANASIMFELSKAVQAPLKRSFGGSDADWVREMKKKYVMRHAHMILYYVRTHNDRIGVWKRRPSANREWYTRMDQYRR